MKKEELIDRFASLLFPQGCVLCGDAVEYDSLWCGACPMFEMEGDICFLCGHLFEDCACGRVKWAFTRSIAPLQYTDSVREAILRVKKKPDRRACLFFAHMMARTVQAEYGEESFDCTVEVPMSPQQLEKRGHNQSELIAAELSALIKLPFERRALLRPDTADRQHTLDAGARFRNAAQSYRIARPGAMRGKTVLLVDDVMTTCATLHACAQAIMDAGAKAVYGVAASATCKNNL